MPSPSGGTNAVNFDGPELHAALKGNDAHAERCRQFFLLLALCHTVVIEEVRPPKSPVGSWVGPELPRPSRRLCSASHDEPVSLLPQLDGKKKLSASSPDESALVAAGAFFGFEFTKRDNDQIYVADTRLNKVMSYTVLAVLDFTSARKRMYAPCPASRAQMACTLGTKELSAPTLTSEPALCTRQTTPLVQPGVGPRVRVAPDVRLSSVRWPGRPSSGTTPPARFRSSPRAPIT